MSLVRLLTAGKSLVGLKESENRYRLTSQRLLPKFEAKKNPFGAGAPGLAEPALVPDQSAQTQPVGAPDAQRDSDAPVSLVPSGVSKPERAPEIGRLWSRCASRFRSLFIFRRGLSVPAIVQRQQSKRLFQSELSLQSVKVLRNDLSDSDVEIVTCKKSAAPKMKTAAAETQNQSAPGAWNKVADTLFGGAKR